MFRFEITLEPDEARRFDRFFWSFVGTSTQADDRLISLTAFTGFDGERRIIAVESPDLEAAFRQAWRENRDLAEGEPPPDEFGAGSAWGGAEAAA